MADEYNTSTNWWDSSRTRFDSTTGSSSSSSGQLNSLGSFGSWPSDHLVDVKSRSSMESASVSDTSVAFHDTQKLQHLQDSATDHHHHLQMMGLGLSNSHPMDWNQALLRGGGDNSKHEGSFRSMLQENLNSTSNYQQETGIGGSPQVQWRERVFSGGGGGGGGGDSSVNPRGFSLEQPQFSPHGSSSDSTVTNFQMDYGNPSTMFQGLLSDNHQQQQQQQQQSSLATNYPYGGNNYCLANNELVPSPSSWSKVPQFLRNNNSPPKQNHLHFSNNAPFWNASATSINDVRPTFFPSLQPQFPSSDFEEKPKKISEVRESSCSTTTAKKNATEGATKRARNETTSPVPPFKVRKEKMGDRITALQQLVSPFGKTDTASVLSEAIEYIKFLHEQVTVLSTPYMKSGAPIHHQQNSDKSKDPEGQKQADLRSRGLCLVPVSSTFPVTHETTVDFWTPTFGGTFR
ncbi:transcription factor bHLH123-like isoform X2 [Mercurialis annua]|uniref:transcription factor bHLH123-like isoform X2 n=1 Tax=Mercurialis annua TaxID=3986 RepID=UPI00215FD4D1|nr:transcription factor bHLH123-like isoform X2 [Mercurialis annua]